MLAAVALFARAWIETSTPLSKRASLFVALFARAWIETAFCPRPYAKLRSPSSRGRGLKRLAGLVALHELLSPSSRGRGLKPNPFDAHDKK